MHGLYGAEHWIAGRLDTLPDAPEVDEARSSLPAVVAAVPGTGDVWIEDKRLSLVVHTRRSADPEGLLTALRPGVQDVADQTGLELHDGHLVLELRLPGFDKGQVLTRLADEFGGDAVLYAGDDRGDAPAFDAIAALRERGMFAAAVLVGTGHPELAGCVDLTLDAPADLVGLLDELTAGS